MTNPKNGGNMALNWENEEEDLDTLSPLDEEGDEEGGTLYEHFRIVG